MREHWITSAWRPVTAMVFVVLTVCRWLGVTAPNSEAEALAILQIIAWMLGGYTIGRCLEKGAAAISSALRKD